MGTKATDAVVLDAGEPSLVLSDIIHTMSPSPSPRNDMGHQRAETASPEPLTEVEISQMRRRVTEMESSSGKWRTDASEREKELIDMVIRLTGSTFLDPTQLNRQADAISWLTSQRDFLLKQAEEERERWESEKDGWARMAEALISRRNKPGTATAKDADPDRQYYFASDNRVLREKLHDTQARLQALESELVKLRPILLMQPAFSQSQSSLGYTSSFLSSTPFPSLHVAKSKSKKKKKEAKSSRQAVPDSGDQEGSDDPTQMQTDTQPAESVEPSSFLQFQSQSSGISNRPAAFTGDHYRNASTSQVSGPPAALPTTIQFQVSSPVPLAVQTSPSTHSPQHPHPPSQNVQPSPSNLVRKGRPKSRHPQGGSVPVIPLTSDARSEHLLLAARRIGRERAGIVAGYIRDRVREQDAQKKEQDRERERVARETEKLERERQERLAERGAGGLSYYRRESTDLASASPKTPKRGNGNGSHYPNSSGGSGGNGGMAIQNPQPLNPAFAFVDLRKAPGRSAPTSQVAPQTAATDAFPTTPRQGGSGPGNQHQPGQGTPLASLIDAARMMHDGGKEATIQANGGGRRRSVEATAEPESPAPKRRKVGRKAGSAGASRGGGAGAGAGEGGKETPGLARMKSALDVLADQAAAFSSTGNGKGKEKEIEPVETVVDDDGAEAGMSVAPKSKRKVRATEKVREKEREKEKAKSASVRKPRVRAPPKERKLAPAPSPDIAVDVDITPTAGKAAPRMISPPRPRQLSSSGVAGSRDDGNGRASPLDMLPPTKVVPSLRKEVQLSDVQQRSMGEVILTSKSKFGFGPVPTWDRSGSDEEKEGEGSSSSLLRDGIKSTARRESEPQGQKIAGEVLLREEESGTDGLRPKSQEKRSNVEMAVDITMETHSTATPSPELDAGRDDSVVSLIIAEQPSTNDLQSGRSLRDEEPDVDRQDISMGLDKPSDVEQSSGPDETQNPQRSADMQEPVDGQHSMQKDDPRPGNRAEVEPIPWDIGSSVQASSPAIPQVPQAGQAGNSATSLPLSLSTPDPSRQLPDTVPQEDADADADADADEDADAEGEADADGDVDLDADGEIDLGSESVFSGPSTLFTDSIDPTRSTTYPSSMLPSSLPGVSDVQNGKAQIYCANSIAIEDASWNPVLADNLSSGEPPS